MPNWKLSISNIGWAAAKDEAVYTAMQAAGFTGLEIAPTRVFGPTPYENLNAAALFGGYLQTKWGLRVPSMQSIWYGVSGNIFNADDHAALLATTEQAFALAHTLNCPSLVFGCPRNRQLPPGREHDAATLAVGEQLFDKAGTLASRHGTRLALEANAPTYTNYLTTTRQALDVVRRLGNPGLSVNFDLATVLYNGEDLAEFTAEDFAFVSHVHISEPGLAPLTPRPEHARLKELLAAVGYRGFVSIEMGAADLATVQNAITYIAEVFA